MTKVQKVVTVELVAVLVLVLIVFTALPDDRDDHQGLQAVDEIILLDGSVTLYMRSLWKHRGPVYLGCNVDVHMRAGFTATRSDYLLEAGLWVSVRKDWALALFALGPGTCELYAVPVDLFVPDIVER